MRKIYRETFKCQPGLSAAGKQIDPGLQQACPLVEQSWPDPNASIASGRFLSRACVCPQPIVDADNIDGFAKG